MGIKNPKTNLRSANTINFGDLSSEKVFKKIPDVAALVRANFFRGDASSRGNVGLYCLSSNLINYKAYQAGLLNDRANNLSNKDKGL